MRAFKSVYDFVVYVGCEIGKHNYTIQVYPYDQIERFYHSARAKIQAAVTRERLHIAWVTLKYLFYGFALFFVVNFIIVLLRERFELEGCVFCVEKEVDKISALVSTQRDNFV